MSLFGELILFGQDWVNSVEGSLIETWLLLPSVENVQEVLQGFLVDGLEWAYQFLP